MLTKEQIKEQIVILGSEKSIEQIVEEIKRLEEVVKLQAREIGNLTERTLTIEKWIDELIQ